MIYGRDGTDDDAALAFVVAGNVMEPAMGITQKVHGHWEQAFHDATRPRYPRPYTRINGTKWLP